MAINDVFEALSQPVRLKVLTLLKKGPMSAGDLAAHFDLTNPTMSSFAKLKDVDLVITERNGTSLIYHLNLSILEDAMPSFMSFRSLKK